MKKICNRFHLRSSQFSKEDVTYIDAVNKIAALLLVYSIDCCFLQIYQQKMSNSNLMSQNVPQIFLANTGT